MDLFLSLRVKYITFVAISGIDEGLTRIFCSFAPLVVVVLVVVAPFSNEPGLLLFLKSSFRFFDGVFVDVFVLGEDFFEPYNELIKLKSLTYIICIYITCKCIQK